MPIFQFTDDDGGIYHLEAPDEDTAYALFQSGPQEGAEDDRSGSRRLSSFQPPVAQSETADANGGDDNSSLTGIGKAYGTGVASSSIRLAGIPGDVVGASRRLLGDQSGEPSFLGADYLRQMIESQTGPFYQPKGKPEEVAQTIGEMTPSMLAAPHTSAARFLSRVAPVVANGVAGQFLKDTPLEVPAGIAGAFIRGQAALPSSIQDFQQVVKSALMSNLWPGEMNPMASRGQNVAKRRMREAD